MQLCSFFPKIHVLSMIKNTFSGRVKLEDEEFHKYRTLAMFKHEVTESWEGFQKGDAKRLQWYKWLAPRPEIGLKQFEELRINKIQKIWDTHMSFFPFSCVYKASSSISCDVKIKSLTCQVWALES